MRKKKWVTGAKIGILEFGVITASLILAFIWYIDRRKSWNEILSSLVVEAVI